jgi:ferredoxin-type protein NapF
MELLRGRAYTVRPPWSIDEQLFVECCSRCDECIKACPTKIIERGRGGFPVLDFKKGECEFCGDCLSICKTGAITRDTESTPAWDHKINISEKCITYHGVVCRSCGEFCEERVITFRPAIGGISKPELILDQCNGCGACVAVCPVSAVTVSVEAVPQNKWLLEERA